MNRLDADRLVDVALDPADTLVVDVDGAEHVAGEPARGIGAPQLLAEGEAGKAEIVNALRERG